MNIMYPGRCRLWLAAFLGLPLLLVAQPEAPTEENAKKETAKEEAYRGEGDLIFLRDFGSDDVGYLAVPTQRPEIGIVLVHGWTGLSEGVRRDADHLAGNGNLALAVDLFNGVRPRNDREAKVERGKLQAELVVTTIRTGARFFEGSPRFKMERVAVVACQQAAPSALIAAREQPNIMAVVLIEPEPALSPEDLAQLPVPVKIIADAGKEADAYLARGGEGTGPGPTDAWLEFVSPVWINSWRNRRVNTEIWKSIQAFLQPIEARKDPLTKRLWKTVF